MSKLLKIYADSFSGLSRESWMLAIVILINRAGSMVLPFLGVYMTDHLHFSLKTTGILLSFYGIGAVLGSWLGGILTDKIGEYKVQSFSLLATVPLFMIVPFFKTEIELALLILTITTISEIFRPANSVAITKYARKGNLTRSFSLNRMAVNLGFAIGPAMGGILSAISYDFLFYSNGVATLLAGITYIWFFKGRNSKESKIKIEKSPVKEPSPYKDLEFALFCVVCLLFAVCFFQLLNTLTIFYKEEVGLSQTSIGMLIGFSGLLIVLLEMLLVQLAEKKLSIANTLFWGSIVTGISFAMLSLNHSLGWLFFSITLFSIGEIWILPFTSTVTALRSGVNNKGAYMGMLGIAFSLSFIITPILGTWIAENYSFDTLWIGTGVVLAFTAAAFYFSASSMFGKLSKLPKH